MTEPDVRVLERRAYDRPDVAKVIARRELGHDAAVWRMNLHLGMNDVRKDVPNFIDDGRSCLVTGRLDA
jgi:hypothetical protein